MENLMFCLNATGPIFLMMVFGLFLRKVGILDEDFANRMNKFVFKIPLPFLLFSDLAAVDFSRVWNIKFIVFCFVVTLISITISTLVSCLWRDKSIRGEFIQASYRSSAALLYIVLCDVGTVVRKYPHSPAIAFRCIYLKLFKYIIHILKCF